MVTDSPTDQSADNGDPNRLLTPEEIAECEQMRLALLTDLDLLQVSCRHDIWRIELNQQFGSEIGEQLAAQQVTVGMTLEHLTASFGVADQRKEDGPVTTYIYGNKKTGSYFDVRNGVITAAVIKVLPLPPVPLEA